jgi:hypothetical protein
MQIHVTARGCEVLEHPAARSGMPTRLGQQSSAMGDAAEAWERPGSRYLWMGKDQQRTRDDVQERITALQRWCATGSLHAPEEVRP